jgi:hypothetical protein
MENKTYDFLKSLASPVCRYFTSSKFDVVSKDYPFANAPSQNACSSPNRLSVVKHLIKQNPFPCQVNTETHSFSDCDYYSPVFEILKKYSVSNKNSFELVKMKIDDVSYIYAVCSVEAQMIFTYFKFSEIKDQEAISLFDEFISEASNSFTYSESEIVNSNGALKSQKTSYLNSLMSIK